MCSHNLGPFPETPASDSTVEQKGRFALFMLLLFKPWRSLKKDVLACLSTESDDTNTSPWQRLFAHFESCLTDMVALSQRVRSEYEAQTPGEGESSLLTIDGSVSWQSKQYCVAPLRGGAVHA